MPAKATRALQLAVGCGVSGLAIYLLLQQVALEKLGEALARAQPLPMALLVLSIVPALLTRAARWGVLFLPERRVPFRPLLGTLAISYMASTFLPFRAGELVRALFLAQREGIPLPRVAGTILLEKLFDFLAIGVMLLLLLLTTPLPPEALLAGWTVALVILGGFGFVVLLAVWRAPMLRLLGVAERLVPFGLGGRLGVVRAAAHFAEGTDSLRVGALWVPLLLWSAFTWAMSLAGTWAGGWALGVPLPLAAVAFVAVATSVGQAVPSSPGYVGVYHGAAVLALTTFGVDPTEALGVAVLTHALSYGTLVLAGPVAPSSSPRA